MSLFPSEYFGWELSLFTASLLNIIGVSRLCRLAAPGMMISIRSIFSTCNALCQGGLLTLLDVPPSICYPSGRRWQRRGPKPGEQHYLDLRISRESASRHDSWVEFWWFMEDNWSLTPADKLAGLGPVILADRDRKLEPARDRKERVRATT